MSTRTIAVLAMIAVLFAVGFLAIIVTQRSAPNAPPSKPPVALQSFDGKLAIQSIDDLRVGGRKILLCGAAFSKPRAMRAMVEQVARRDYQNLTLNCKPVGMGTPCDGKVATKFGDAVVVQCFLPDGTDLAAKLTQEGILCGQPAQVGATYKAC